MFLKAEEIHKVGLDEVKRIEKEMQKVVKEVGHDQLKFRGRDISLKMFRENLK